MNDAPPAAAAAEQDNAKPTFLIAGIGGSAGALEAFTELLGHLPPTTPVAVVIVQHLSSGHESLLVELLARVTALPVKWAENGVKLEPHRVYILPPKSALILREGRFCPQTGELAGGGIIDVFFRSLAKDVGHRAVGIICSGNGSDGAHGLKAINAAGGTVFVQREETATFPAMPHAAIETGCVDGVFTPVEIAAELGRLADGFGSSWHALTSVDVEKPDWEARALRNLFRLLLQRRGVDFTDYKQTTIKRRIFRRMLITRNDTIGNYVTLVERSPAELDALFDSLLINVTEFFRDLESFEHLERHILPALIDSVAPDSALRIWVPGCSSGQEAYSLGILVREILDETNRSQAVQIFGTDLSEHAIAAARAGIYSSAELAMLAPARLSRFFDHRGGSFAIKKSIRDMCVFARQNVVRDAPFSKIDLISCRNLLIYFDSKLQHKVLPIFHYALNPRGVLTLGNSESVGGSTDLFRPLDRRHRIYTRTSSERRTTFEFSTRNIREAPLRPPPASPLMAHSRPEPYDLIHEADRFVVENHAPPGVLVAANFDAVQFRGDVSPYLSPYSGHASLNLFKIAREGLSGELESALLSVQESNAAYHKEGLTVVHNKTVHQFVLEVMPLQTPSGPRGYLVLFADTKLLAASSPEGGATPSAEHSALMGQIEQLKAEVQSARNHLHATRQKSEITSQEARAANEEIQSSNEELQSTNEELETAKEELQSTNEELATVNQELHSRQLELIQVNNDLTNLINSVQLPVIILSEDLRIRRFTASAENVLNLIPADIGRPLSDINIKLKFPDLPRLVAEVTGSLTLREFEVQDLQGRWFSVRIRPYKTAENKIEGVVISMMDVDQIKRAQATVEYTRDVAEAILNAVTEPMAVLDDKLAIYSGNESFYRLLSSSAEQFVGKPFLGLLETPEQVSALRRELLEVLPTQNLLRNYPLRLATPLAPAKEVNIDARQVTRGERRYPFILVSFHGRDGAKS